MKIYLLTFLFNPVELDVRFSSLSTILRDHHNLEVFDVFHINQVRQTDTVEVNACDLRLKELNSY